MIYIRQVYRMQTIDRLIQQGRTGSADELGSRLGVSTITIYRYIQELKDLGAPIRFSRRIRSYVYTQDFDLFKSSLPASRQSGF